MLDEMKKVVGELYELYGATPQVVKMSEILDQFIFVAQEEQMIGEDVMDYKKEYEEISKLYDKALDRIVKLYRDLGKLQDENKDLQYRLAKTEGKLDEVRNMYRMLTGREDM